jgi:hypothetical protein
MPALLPSELPVLAVARLHWIVMLRRPHPLLAIALVVLLAAAVFDPSPMALIFLLVLCAGGFFRYQNWRAEQVILTRRRIIRVRGVPETTKTEASLRLDRISGAVLQQTVLGKLLGYGSIELEAPGQHPDVRVLSTIARPHRFYLQVRRVVFGAGADLDPDDVPPDPTQPGRPPQPPGMPRAAQPWQDDTATAPLPFLEPPPPRPRLR